MTLDDDPDIRLAIAIIGDDFWLWSSRHAGTPEQCLAAAKAAMAWHLAEHDKMMKAETPESRQARDVWVELRVQADAQLRGAVSILLRNRRR